MNIEHRTLNIERRSEENGKREGARRRLAWAGMWRGKRDGLTIDDFRLLIFEWGEEETDVQTSPIQRKHAKRGGWMWRRRAWIEVPSEQCEEGQEKMVRTPVN